MQFSQGTEKKVHNLKPAAFPNDPFQLMFIIASEIILHLPINSEIKRILSANQTSQNIIAICQGVTSRILFYLHKTILPTKSTYSKSSEESDIN